MKMKILIADDDPAMLHLMGAILTREGFAVESCLSGAEVLKHLEVGERFALAIFDEKMPTIKGSELATWMKHSRIYKNTPIIMLSGEDDPLLFGELMQKKIISGFLSKPFKTEALMTLLRLFIRASARQHTNVAQNQS